MSWWSRLISSWPWLVPGKSREWSYQPPTKGWFELLNSLHYRHNIPSVSGNCLDNWGCLFWLGLPHPFWSQAWRGFQPRCRGVLERFSRFARLFLVVSCWRIILIYINILYTYMYPDIVMIYIIMIYNCNNICTYHISYISIIRTLLIISVSAFFSPCSTHWPICRRLQLQRAPLVWRFAKDAHFFCAF